MDQQCIRRKYHAIIDIPWALGTGEVDVRVFLRRENKVER